MLNTLKIVALVIVPWVKIYSRTNGSQKKKKGEKKKTKRNDSWESEVTFDVAYNRVRVAYAFDGRLCPIKHKAESKTFVNTLNEKQK